MEDTLCVFQSNNKLELRITTANDFGLVVANKYSKKTTKCVTSAKLNLVATGNIGTFLFTTSVLEIARRISAAHCPFIWRALQALQISCCSPFKWIPKWALSNSLVKGMQTLSMPSLFLSVATVLFNKTDFLKGTLSSSTVETIELSSQLVTQDIRLADNVSTSVVVEDWLVELYSELNKEGLTLLERMTVNELNRFCAVSDGDFAMFLSSVKNTIRWRQKYGLFSPQLLKTWDNFVFWHGTDVMQQPCLIIRIGLAGHLPSVGQEQFARAVDSQLEYGVQNLLDAEHPHITILMDCKEFRPFEIPWKALWLCISLLQDHYPNRLGRLLAVRIIPILLTISHILFQDLKPREQQKLTVTEQDHQEVLSKYFEVLPPFLGGNCSCPKCAK